MAVVLSLNWFRRIGMAVLLTSTAACASDFCSLTVHVETPSGYAPTGVSVGVLESSGRTETLLTSQGEAKFCGLGIGPVTIEVGGRERCNPVSVRNVALSWGTERVLRVVYDNGLCHGDEIQSAG